MEVELWSGDTKAIIDPKGAWLTNLSDEFGDVLFPKRLFRMADGSTKQRGGLHVCLPNFGPGGESSQPQHGFGRLADWEVDDKTENSLSLLLREGVGEYAAMSSTLLYQLDGQTLTMTLELINNGQKDLRVAPAFHPYFAVTGDVDSVIIDDEIQLFDDLVEAQFTSGETHQLQTQNRYFTLWSDTLTTWAQWTDQLGAYVCVEPTLGGDLFLSKLPQENEILRPGETKTYAATISWRQNNGQPVEKSV